MSQRRTADEIEFDVVIPAYNAAATLERALRSVLAQTHRRFTICVVVDGATDDSVAVARDVLRGEAGASVIEQKNAGVSAARNRGVRAGQSPFVAFLDADDEWLPAHLATLASLIADANGDGLFSTAYRMAESGGVPVDVVHAAQSGPGALAYFKASLAARPPVWIGATAISRRCFEVVGGFRVPAEDPHVCGEDVEFLMQTACRFPVWYAPEVTSLYRWNPRAGSALRYCPSGRPYVWERGMELLSRRAVPGPIVRDFARYVARLGLFAVGERILRGRRKHAWSLFVRCIPYHVEIARRVYWLAMLCLPLGVTRPLIRWARLLYSGSSSQLWRRRQIAGIS